MGGKGDDWLVGWLVGVDGLDGFREGRRVRVNIHLALGKGWTVVASC